MLGLAKETREKTRPQETALHVNGSPFRNLYPKIVANENAPLITSVGFRHQNRNAAE